MNKLERLHELREKAGIKFNKSFNCQEAEKNIHLVDKDKFFKKFVKKLEDMGYEISDDFTFDIIRHKYQYAERHHIGKTYEWKYFYSTTFEISQEMIDFLERHLFIKNKIKKLTKEQTRQFNREKEIERLEKALERNKQKIKSFLSFVKSSSETGNLISVENYKKAIEKCKEKNKNITEKLKLLREIDINV